MTKKEVKKAVAVLVRNDVMPWEYEREMRRILTKTKPKYRVGDEIIIKTTAGDAEAVIIEIDTNCILRKIYKIKVNNGYAWWKESDIVGRNE